LSENNPTFSEVRHVNSDKAHFRKCKFHSRSNVRITVHKQTKLLHKTITCSK